MSRSIYLPVNGIGLGHAARSLEVAKFLARRGFVVVFSSWGDAVRLIRSTGFECIEVPGIELAWRGPSLDFARSLAVGSLTAPLTIGKQVSVEMKLLSDLEPAAVISDSRAAPLIAARLAGVKAFLISNQLLIFVPREKRFRNLSRLVDAGGFSILSKIWSLAETIYIPDLPPPYTISMYNLEPYVERLTGKLMFIGPLVRPQPTDAAYAEEVEAALPDGRPTLLFAISGPRAEREAFVELVRGVARELARRFRVIISAGRPGGDEAPKVEEGYVFIEWARQRAALMQISDVIVSRAGLTTITEAIALKKPLIVVPTPGQSEQYGNAKRVEEVGLGRFLEQRDFTTENVLKAAAALLSDETVKENLERAAAVLSSLRGAGGIAEDVVRRTLKGA